MKDASVADTKRLAARYGGEPANAMTDHVASEEASLLGQYLHRSGALPAAAPPPVDAGGASDNSASDSDEASTATEDTLWRAQSKEELERVDVRVSDAFEALNCAIARNNEVEMACGEVQRQLTAQREAGEAKLAILEQRHKRQLRKIDEFREEQRKAREAEGRLHSVSAAARAAREVLECVREALSALQDVPNDDQGRCEAQRVLEQRQRAAEAELGRLELQRRRATCDAERCVRRVMKRAAAVSDAAEAALPFLTRLASHEHKQHALQASLREKGEATMQAKALVKEAMGDLERISLDIMKQQQQQSAPSTPPPPLPPSGNGQPSGAGPHEARSSS